MRALATGAGETHPFEAVVLAAGTGSRFGGRKLLAPYMAGVLLDGALAAAFAAPVRSVTLVTGADSTSVSTAALAFAEKVGQAERLRIVHADDYAEGMAHSLRMGVAALPPETGAAFIFLGDMPRVPRAVLAGMAAAVRAGAPAAAPSFAGRRGNPVLVGRELFPELLGLTGDAGARRVLDRMGDLVALVDAPDDGVLFDVDERSDLP